MATNDVHEAFKTLSPSDHGEFPSDASALREHLASTLVDAHTLISSIPPPTSAFPENLNLPNTDSRALQEWKPVKLSAKDNPLDISVFKLSAKDGKGSWFARRSIHTDIPFQRFKTCLQKEFEQSLKGEASSSGAIRGFGNDSRVYYETCELGAAEILHLSAQFPGPSAPRDFVQGRCSTSAHPGDLSSTSETKSPCRESTRFEEAERPKQFTIISKPVLNHPECNEQAGYVRANYESIEFIREIPIPPKSLDRSQSTPDMTSFYTDSVPSLPRGKTVVLTSQGTASALGPYPVDWIMITRSDPGGSVPRWVVERATPSSIAKEAEKFLKWCSSAVHLDEGCRLSMDSTVKESVQDQGEANDEELNAQTMKQLSGRNVPSGIESPLEQRLEMVEPTPGTPASRSNSGSLSNALSTVTASVTTSTNPRSLATIGSDNATHFLKQPEDDQSDDAESICTFATCVTEPSQETDTSLSTRTSSINSTNPHATAPAASTRGNNPTEDHPLAYFLKEKLKLEEKYKRDEFRRSEREKKLTEKHLKNLEKQERKYQRAVEKANQKDKKEQEKEQEKKMNGLKKKLEPEVRNRNKEFEEMKKVVEALTKENLELRLRIEELSAAVEGRKENSTTGQADN